MSRIETIVATVCVGLILSLFIIDYFRMKTTWTPGAPDIVMMWTRDKEARIFLKQGSGVRYYLHNEFNDSENRHFTLYIKKAD